MYGCDVVVDKKLVMRATDDDFYKLVGEKNYGALYVSAHPDDLPLLLDAAQRLEYGNPITMLCRFKVADDSYHFMMLRLYYESEKCVESDRIHVSFIDMDVVSDTIREDKKKLTDAERFLALSDAIWFEYDRIKHFLRIYTVNWNDQYVIFEGDDAAWLEHSKNLPIVEADIEVLKSITEDILNGGGDVSDTITYKQDTGAGEFKKIPAYFAGSCVHVKSRRVTGDGDDRVLGIMTLGDEKASTSSEGVMDNCMDSTFNVYNKKTVTNYAETSIAMGKSGYICVMDIDNFKTVNDTYGHSFGDEVIKSVIEIARSAVRGAGMLGRIGGDEFMIVLDRDISSADLRSKLRTIRSQVEFEFQSRGYSITVSIGSAGYEYGDMTYDKTFRLADKMLYRAKEKGRNRYIIYEPEIHGTPEEILSGVTVTKDKNHSEPLMSKESFLMSFAELFSYKKTMSYSFALESIAEVFDLDEIHLYFDDLETPNYTYALEHSIEKRKLDFFDCEVYKARLNDQNVAAIAHPNTLGDVDNELVAYMNRYEYEAMVVFKGQKPNTCFVFAKRGSDIRKWENSDIAYLGFLSKLIELEFEAR